MSISSVTPFSFVLPVHGRKPSFFVSSSSCRTSFSSSSTSPCGSLLRRRTKQSSRLLAVKNAQQSESEGANNLYPWPKVFQPRHQPTLPDKEWKSGLLVGHLIPIWALLSSPPASALLVKYTDEEWNQIYITTGILLFAYFIVAPLIVYNYLRLRWYKRKLAETIFQFLLVFLFFPGMMLLAPFINFRRFPRDPSMKEPWS